MKMIWVTFRKAGLHYYPAAGTQGLEDVEYLRYSHRHLFHFKVAVEVFHDDRDIEFHQLLNYLESNLTTEKLNHKSCEMIANDVFFLVREKHQHKDNDRKVIVEVSEDGECGVTADYILMRSDCLVY
jgi:hypothetical protein